MNEYEIVSVHGLQIVEPLTGELIEIANPNIPVRSKVDAVKWYLNKIQFDIDECKDRKARWSDKQKRYEEFKTELKALLAEFIRDEGLKSVKTPEHTAFLSTRKSHEYKQWEEGEDENEVVFELTAKMTKSELLKLDLFGRSNIKFKELGILKEVENEFLTIR